MNDLTAELHDPRDRPLEVVDREVRQRNAVTGPGTTLVHPELGASRMRLAPLPFALRPRLELDAEHACPEPLRPLDIIRGKLDQRDHVASLEPRELVVHDLERTPELLPVPRLVEPPARSGRMRQRHADGVADRKATAHALEASLPEQPPDREPADDEDEPRAYEAELPLPPERA